MRQCEPEIARIGEARGASCHVIVIEAYNRHMGCPLCGQAEPDDDSTYPNQVCDDCDARAVNEAGERPWHGWPPGEEPDAAEGVIRMPSDRGENPVFIDGEKCWRRYRFGGWVTMKDDHDCDSLEEFYEQHGLL